MLQLHPAGTRVRARGGPAPSICLFMEITESKKILPKVLLTPKRFKAPNPSFLPPTWENPKDVAGLRRLGLRLLSLNAPELKTFILQMGGTVSVEPFAIMARPVFFLQMTILEE